MANEGKHEGHIATKINAADILAKFFGAQFKVRGNASGRRKRLMEELGIATRQDFEKVTEEIDRLQGMLKALERAKAAEKKAAKKRGKG